MLASFLAGILFAIGHHLFHSHLDGRLVISSTQQQWDGRVSLGLTLFVRYSFKICISIAIVQALWRGLKNKVEGTQLGTIDKVAKLLSDPRSFASKGVWEFSWPLAIVALLSWFV